MTDADTPDSHIKAFAQNWLGLWARAFRHIAPFAKPAFFISLALLGATLYLLIPPLVYSYAVYGHLFPEGTTTQADDVIVTGLMILWTAFGFSVAVAADRTWNLEVLERL